MMANSRPLLALVVSVSSLLVLRWCLVGVLCLSPTPGSYNSLVGEEVPLGAFVDDDGSSNLAPEYAFAEGGDEGEHQDKPWDPTAGKYFAEDFPLGTTIASWLDDPPVWLQNLKPKTKKKFDTLLEQLRARPPEERPTAPEIPILRKLFKNLPKDKPKKGVLQKVRTLFKKK
ncbi:hypothetical protein CSUI_001937 [Cystoisospora suis]|uniref:Transmembrane protein n=1 Tax=Cystoisospora suis TaxID=483139 RepID=A0A2C6KJI5_9APIC|nr:hypothetical protein CSUI_001937 [Cystoisospora suis]